MLSISHAMTGAYIATRLHNPLLAFPVILASHYLEDWILHWDVGTGLTNGSRSKRTAFILELGDLAIAGLLVLFIFQPNFFAFSWIAIYGAFIGLLPDFVEAPRNFWHFNPPILKIFNDFHHNFHRSTPNILLGLIPQIIVVSAIIALR
ncbi:MAG TPA: hypothetical protein VLH19_01615 [Patescibacteria group bacterium]|nr:hypothetical protein [Patescibacteria group bacterium]